MSSNSGAVLIACGITKTLRTREPVEKLVEKSVDKKDEMWEIDEKDEKDEIDEKDEMEKFEQPIGRSFRGSKEDEKRIKSGNLISTIMDISLVRKLFLSKGIKIHAMKMASKETKNTRSDVMSSLESLFDSNYQNCFIFYSGHGGSKSGRWCFEKYSVDKTDDVEYEWISLSDIMALWNARFIKNSKQQLIIISDSCFSGKWIEEAIKSKLTGVIIQTSCRPCEVAHDTIDGGLFTKKWVKGIHKIPSQFSYFRDLAKAIQSAPGYIKSLIVGYNQSPIVYYPGKILIENKDKGFLICINSVGIRFYQTFNSLDFEFD